jgi:hypothetical protein
MSPWEQNLSLQQQKILVNGREAFMARFRTKDERDRCDRDCFADLIKVSPEKLAPVAFESDQHGQMVGFMIQKVGNGSHRVLVCLLNWKILRIKRSATIRRVADDELFRKAIEAQRVALDAVQTLLLGNSKNGAVRSQKRLLKNQAKEAVG